MQIMLQVPLVVDQVLYAYNKERQETYQKNVLNCWVNLLFWFWFFFSFHLAFSSCGSLLHLLQGGCRQYRVPAEDSIAGQTIPVVLKAHPILPTWDWLMRERFPEWVCTLESSCPSFLPFPLPVLSGGRDLFLPWEPRPEPACELKTCRSSCRDSVL